MTKSWNHRHQKKNLLRIVFILWFIISKAIFFWYSPSNSVPFKVSYVLLSEKTLRHQWDWFVKDMILIDVSGNRSTLRWLSSLFRLVYTSLYATFLLPSITFGCVLTKNTWLTECLDMMIAKTFIFSLLLSNLGHGKEDIICSRQKQGKSRGRDSREERSRPLREELVIDTGEEHAEIFPDYS